MLYDVDTQSRRDNFDRSLQNFNYLQTKAKTLVVCICLICVQGLQQSKIYDLEAETLLHLDFGIL